jgi:hypothetical protein
MDKLESVKQTATNVLSPEPVFPILFVEQQRDNQVLRLTRSGR